MANASFSILTGIDVETLEQMSDRDADLALRKAGIDISTIFSPAPSDTGTDILSLPASGAKVKFFSVEFGIGYGFIFMAEVAALEKLEEAWSISLKEPNRTEENLASFFDLATDMLWVLDEAGTIIATNASTRLGYAEGELLGKSVLEVHPSAERARAFQIVMAMLSGDETACPIPLVRKDGSMLPVETKVNWGNWSGKRAIFGSSRDISEIKLSEEKFSRVFNSSPSLMAISSPEDGRFIEVNESFLRMLGYRRDEVIGKTSRDLNLYSDFRNRDKTAVTLMQDDAPVVTEQQTRTKEGKILDGIYTIQPIAIGGKKNIFSVMQDVTEQRIAETKLKRLLEFEESLARTTSLLLCPSYEDLGHILEEILGEIGKFSGSDNAYIFRFNTAHQFMSNTHEWHAPGIAPGKNHLQNLPMAAFPEWMQALASEEDVYITSVESLPAAWTVEKEALWPKGIQSLLAVPVRSGKDIFGYMGFEATSGSFEWTMESRRLLRLLANNLAAVWMQREEHLELQLATIKARQLAQDAAVASKAKSDFLAMISHEIRTPMNGVVNASRFLGETALDQKQQHYLKILQTSSDSLLSVLNDILDNAKIESGKMSVETISFHPEEVISLATGSFASQAESKQVALTCSIDQSLPSQLLGDPTKLTLIINNLLSNALKFTDRGRVHLSANVVDWGKNSIGMQLNVEDTGIGFSDDAIPRIFESFNQADPSIVRKYGGSGLGLPIVKQLCHLMGGSVSVHSEVDRGSVFSVNLPFGLAPREMNPALREEDPGRMHRYAIIGYKDVPALQIKDILGSWGVDATYFTGFEEAQAERGKDPGIEWVFIMSEKEARRLASLKPGQPGNPGASFPKLFVAVKEKERARQDKELGNLEIAGFLSIPVLPSTLFSELDIKAGIALLGKLIPQAMPKVRYDNSRTLIVEPHAMSVEIASQYLQKMGFTVESAKDGSQALSLLADQTYDIIFFSLDLLNINDCDTLELVEAARGAQRKSTPVIAMTALEVVEDRDHCIERGFSDRISKPLGPDELETIVRRWMPVEKIASGSSGEPGRTTGHGREYAAENSAAGKIPNPQHQEGDRTPEDKTRELSDLLQHLKKPLIDREPAVCESYIDLLQSELWDSRYKDSLRQIVDAIDNYQFGKALELVGSLLDFIGLL